MKKGMILMLVAFWLVKWTETYKSGILKRQSFEEMNFKTRESAVRFITKRRVDKNKTDFKLYRVEERDIPKLNAIKDPYPTSWGASSLSHYRTTKDGTGMITLEDAAIGDSSLKSVPNGERRD